MVTISTTARSLRDACNQLFSQDGLVDQAISDLQVQAEIQDGLERREAVWQWLDRHQPHMAPWYTKLCDQRPSPVRVADRAYVTNMDGTAELL